MNYLGVRDVEAVQPVMKAVMGALTAGRGRGLLHPERWLLLLSMPRWLLAPVIKDDNPADALRERAHRFFSGGFAQLWREHKWEEKLPTIAMHRAREGKSEEQRGAETVEFIKQAARTRRLRQGAARMMDTPSVPPNGVAYAQLRKLLCADVQQAERAALDKWRTQRRLGQSEERVRALGEELIRKTFLEELVEKWRPRLAAARYKKQPAGTGLRTEHLKPFFESLEAEFVVLFEAIERFAIPDCIARIAATVLSSQLLKRLDDGTPSLRAGTRPIGMGEALFKEAWRARASWAARTIGPALLFYGQMAVGLRSGGEGVATALQLYCDSPQLDDHAVIVALDYSNAYSTSLLDAAARATLMLITWVEQLDEAMRTRLAIKDASEVVKAAEAALDDLAFLRTHHGEVLTVVDGHLERFAVLLGFTQGGLFSSVCFCIAVCFLVLKPLKEEFSEIAPKCIADDAHVPTVIREVPHIERLARWCHRYVTLSIRELHLSANARKFKILQSQRWVNTDLDVARHIKLFPSQMHEGKLKYPTVVRGALKVNGVGVGFDAEARAEIIMAQVKAHEDKLKVLERLTPLLGRQAAELYGRYSCKPSTTFNHQARGNEPSISRRPLEHAGEMQARLFRVVTATAPDEIRDVQHDANPAGPTLRRCEEAMHLSQRHGGAGWTHPRLVAPAASTGRVMDVLYLLRRLEDVSPLVPPPSEWATSGVPLLEEAVAFIAMLVNDSAGFKQGPDDEADDWKYIRGKIVAPDGSLNYEGIELLSGRHFQHVASDALQQDMFNAIVDDTSVHPATRAHFRAVKQLGAGAVLGIDAIEGAVELSDEAFLHEVQGYLNHPRGAITLATRCTGESERTKCDYHASKLRGCPPCAVGAAKEPHILTRYEHFNGTHWDGCRYGGHVGTGHTSINTHVISIARALGAAGSLQEVKLGPRDPNRAVDKESNPNQRGDGVLGNWTRSTRRMVFDGTTITAVQFRKGMLGPLARGTHLATDYAEKAKRSAKAAACAANNYDFMTWAASTRGGIGREAAEWFTTGFATKVALARSDGEKWRVRNERKRLLQQHSAIIARRNWEITQRNAWPRMGGVAPRAPPVE